MDQTGGGSVKAVGLEALAMESRGSGKAIAKLRLTLPPATEKGSHHLTGDRALADCEDSKDECKDQTG